MKDRLAELLNDNATLVGIMCRDPSPTDLELLALAGCHVVWIDLEHSPVSTERAISLCRTISHLGMVSLARVIEPTRTHVQALLDGGFQILLQPNIQNSYEAIEFVRLGKYPPRGERGVSSSAAGLDFDLGSDPQRKLEEANEVTHLMVQFESDAGFANLEDICAVDGIDMVTVGPLDWATGCGLFGEEAAKLAPKIDKVLCTAAEAGKISVTAVGNAKQAEHYIKLGVRILFAGVDVSIKRLAFADAISMVKVAGASGFIPAL